LIRMHVTLSPLNQPPVVVLVEPEIPQNTGNITRLCACTGAKLYLVGKLGFRLDDKFLDRAAMDYRQHVEPRHVWSFDEVLAAEPGYTPWFLSSKAQRGLWDVTFPPASMLVFGSETKGLPPEFVAAHPSQALRLPMVNGARSLNLSNAVAIVLYEALRQYA
jgi:tRNA (cytidine/uridine-2'-O-)-methyltransferase